MKSLAQITNPALPELQGVSGEDFLGRLIRSLIGGAFVIGVVAFLFMLILGAIQWITSGGDKAALENARGKITSSLIGLVVLFAVFAVIRLLESVLGISLLEIDLGPLKITAPQT